MKTGTSVDHDNRARCYIRIAFQCKCLTKSISEKRQLQTATKFLRYSGQIMSAHRLECRDTSRREFLRTFKRYI